MDEINSVSGEEINSGSWSWEWFCGRNSIRLALEAKWGPRGQDPQEGAGV